MVILDMEVYSEIIGDYGLFKKTVIEKKKSKTVRRNDLKAKPDFEEKLSEISNAVKSSWNPKIYRVDLENPGKTLLHWRGEYYVQEESASIPVKVLDPQPGETILDMCAAPGGKTTQIADEIDNKGLVIANDVSSNRLLSLFKNTYRAGAYCVKTTNYDGRSLPENIMFDRILVDAPCTGEGDKAWRDFQPASKKEIETQSRVQQQLLEKAANLIKSGGVIVYSTCTINTRENEEVVGNVIDKTGLKLMDIDAELPPHQEGLSLQSVDGLGKTVRVLPHHLNSGVIYTAKLKYK